ncbi:hypothetical protein M1446_03670 [Candidatus Dependentiae bacterium]|nr:hypothetical protein [Candidatus Dependentiae bacterium]
MKKLLLLLIFISAKCEDNKFVIGTWPHGFFSSFFAVLNNLDWCDKNNKIPVVVWDGGYYFVPEKFNGSNNAWEYYFEPISNLSYSEGDSIRKEYGAPNAFAFPHINPNQENRQRAHAVIQKYIKINPIVQKKIDDFYKQNMEGKKTIGIHLRGTDKCYEIKPIDPDEFFKTANKFKEEYQFLVATDEENLLKEAIKKIEGKVIYYPCYRSPNKMPIHCRSPNKAQVGEDVLIETILLSKCEKLIHSISNVSTAALFFNPELESIFFSSSAPQPEELLKQAEPSKKKKQEKKSKKHKKK